MEKVRIFIDTDCGTDNDDLFALMYAIKNPFCDLVGISTVGDNDKIRSKVVKKLTRIMGIEIPIFSGSVLEENAYTKLFTGVEKKHLTEEERSESVEFGKLEDIVFKKNDRLVCIGPLTNIAYLIDNNPTIDNIKNLYIMGEGKLNHNIKVDITAYEKVIQQDWAINMITKEVSRKITFNLNEMEQYRETKVGSYLYDAMNRWLEYSNKDFSKMYDVIAVSSAIDEGLVDFEKIGIGRYKSIDVEIKLKEKLINYLSC